MSGVAYGVGTESALAAARSRNSGSPLRWRNRALARRTASRLGDDKPKKTSSPGATRPIPTTMARASASRAPAGAAASAGPGKRKRSGLYRLLDPAWCLRPRGCHRSNRRGSSGLVRICRAIQSLEIPKRPLTIQIVGYDGSVRPTRGEQGGAMCPLKDLPPYLPKAFIAIEDRRFYSHYGVDPSASRAQQWPTFCIAASRRAARP